MTPQELTEVCAMLLAHQITNIDSIRFSEGRSAYFYVSCIDWQYTVARMLEEKDVAPTTRVQLSGDLLYVHTNIAELYGIEGLTLATTMPLDMVRGFMQQLLETGAQHGRVMAAIALGEA